MMRLRTLEIQALFGLAVWALVGIGWVLGWAAAWIVGWLR